MSRRGRLPREIGLQLRMALALGLSVALLAAIVGVLLYLTLFVHEGWSLALMAVGFLFIGASHAAKGHRRRRRGPTGDAAERRERRVRRLVQRLAIVADEPPPATELIRDLRPLSWTFARPGRPATIHVTTGLVDRLDDRELAAVLAHELAHLLHRDAAVMTMLAGPPAWLFAGFRALIEEDRVRGTLGVLVFGPLYAPPAVVLLVLSRIVSRYRELAADRAAALLTGSPAAVAAALAAVDEGLRAQRSRDLRRVASRDAFHFVPVRVPRFLGRLWATHPPLRRRVARLERLEAAIQR